MFFIGCGFIQEPAALKYKKKYVPQFCQQLCQDNYLSSNFFSFVFRMIRFSFLANQQNTAVSVVRVGASTQGDDSSQDSNGTCDSQNDGNPHVNLTVEGFYPPSTAQTSASEGK
jgi:hypothetical protein